MQQITGYIFKASSLDWRYHLLRKTGCSLYKKEKTSGKILEFIGTSGVGKSTLYRASMKNLRKKWFYNNHLEFICRKLPPSKTDWALSQILKIRTEEINNSDSFCPWHSLLDLKHNVKVIHDSMLVAQSEFPMGFAFDEGLFRTFPAEILQLGDQFPIQLWKNRAFVYLRARTPEIVLSRYSSRRMIADQQQIHRVRTDDQHLAHIRREQKNFQSVVDRALSFGCPVLVIDAENPLQDSIKKVLDFESSLERRFTMQEKDVKKSSSDTIIR